MKYFLVLGFLFLAGAIYNICKSDYPNMFAGLVLATFLFVIYFSRKRRAAQDAKEVQMFVAQDVGSTQCCKCGGRLDVKLRAYLFTYSVIFYSSKSLGAFKPICDSCSIIAGLPCSFFTFLLGWWGLPHGPIYTVQSIYRNFKGGVVVANSKTDGTFKR